MDIFKKERSFLYTWGWCSSVVKRNAALALKPLSSGSIWNKKNVGGGGEDIIVIAYRSGEDYWVVVSGFQTHE